MAPFNKEAITEFKHDECKVFQGLMRTWIITSSRNKSVISQSLFSLFPSTKWRLGACNILSAICHYFWIFCVTVVQLGRMWPESHEVTECCLNITALPLKVRFEVIWQRENRCAATCEPNHVKHIQSEPSTWIQIHSNACIKKCIKKE